jgi:hypothetical protein
LLRGWVAATIATFGVVAFILTGKGRHQRVQGAVMLVGERTRKRAGNVGPAWDAADAVSLNTSWRFLPTDGSQFLVGGASGAQS